MFATPKISFDAIIKTIVIQKLYLLSIGLFEACLPTDWINHPLQRWFFYNYKYYD